ncbi:hypothetical protein F6X37_36380, partial [Paraburkholderia sp. 31.1]|uniref:hypothetical protein n=1 Tax=Paraburkholderia sp. 31.1 TaxID=2615205 RepID=UPI001CA45B1A
MLGKPPTSPGKDTIGDELIWETLVACVKDDLIIVSGDKTFSNNIPVLKCSREIDLKSGAVSAEQLSKFSVDGFPGPGDEASPVVFEVLP